MRNKNFKGRCEKRVLKKCSDVCRTFDVIQYAYADKLNTDNSIKEFKCNVYMEGLTIGDYTSDFVCVKTDGEIMVRECVFKRLLDKPLTVKRLDASREYWNKRGVSDWGLVIDA